MFRTIVSETPFSASPADSIFGRISGNTFRGDQSFISTLRAMVYPRMPEKDTLTMQYRESFYSKDDISRANSRSVIMAVSSTTVRTDADTGSHFACGMIGIYNCCNSTPEDNDAVLDIIDANLKNFDSGFTKVEKVSEFFKKTFRVICYINPAIKTTLVFCNGMDIRKFHFLQVAIPVFLPWYFGQDAGITDQEMEILQSLRGRDETKYYDAISAIAEKYDFRKLKIEQDLAGFESQYLKIEVDEVTRQIDSKMSDVGNLEGTIAKLMRECYDLNIRLAGLNAKISEGSSSSDIIDYFLCNKNLYLLSVNGSQISFACKGYLEYYDEEIVKKYLENKYSIIYTATSENLRNGISNGDIKLLMTALFVDQTIRMKFCAAFNFDLRGSVTTHGGYKYGSDFSDCTPNTHIDRYNCLGNNEIAINDQLKRNNYIGAIEQCISACKSLNFADGPVLTEFMRRIYGSSTYDVNMRCIELPDGKIVKPIDAIKWLKEQDK